MGIGDWFNNVGDAIEHAADEVETKAGSILDKGAHVVADVARDHGMGGLADVIDEIGDQISNTLGGEIVEKELGQTKDKTELIHGEPSAIHDVAGKLKKMSASIESTGDALQKIDVADWTGDGSTAFHAAFDKQPKLWWTAGDAFTKAAAHLDNWYWAVTTAQAKAQTAIDKWEAALKEEKSKKSAWNGLSDKDKKSTPLVDTWTAMREEARDILKNARSQRDSIAAQVAAGLQTETQEAPATPPLSERLSDDFSDLTDVYEYGKNSFGAGLLTSLSSIVQFARAVNPTDPYNLTHPAEYLTSMNDLGTGLVTAAADPGAVVNAMWTDAKKNPFEAGGAITGNILLTVATGGAGTAPKVAVETVEQTTNAVRLTSIAAHTLEDTPGVLPKALPTLESPAAAVPGRAAPAVERPIDPAGAGTPKDTRPNPTQPGASAPQSPGAGVPKPDATTPRAGVPEGGPAAGPHPDGPVAQANPTDVRPGVAEPAATTPGAADAAPRPEGVAPQPDQPAAARPVDGAPEPSPGSHPDQTGGNPGHVDDRLLGDEKPAPRAGPDAQPSQPALTRPDTTSGGLHPEKPVDPAPEHPSEPRSGQQSDVAAPGTSPEKPSPATPHNESPAPAHNPAPEGRPAGPEHDSTHPDGHDASNPDGHGSQPEPEPAPVQDNSRFEDRVGADEQAPDHTRAGEAEDTNDLTKKVVTKDPIDIATGAFLLPETDIDLPGVLGLVLRRTHRSSYQFGRWFGPSWSATLDMRLVIDAEGIAFLGEDGVMLAFPHAEVGVIAEPVAGGNGWSLTRTETGAYQVRDSKRERVWHFAPEPGLDGLDARLGNLALSAITDRHNNRVRFHYDNDGVPVAVTHSGGYRVDIDCAAGRVTALTVVGDDGTGVETRTRVREFTYSSGNLVAVTNAVGASRRYTYDDHARMLSWTDSNDNRMINIYDQAGRVVHQRGTDGMLDCDLEYGEFPNDTGQFTSVTNSFGAATTHGFDRDLRLRDIVDPVGGYTHIDYNAAREPLKVIAADGAITQYFYTSTGDLARITRPDGSTIDVEYAANHRPAAISEPDGAVRHQVWDAAGNRTAVVDAAGVRTEYRYHPGGAVAEILESTGARTFFEVDASGLPVVIIDPSGATTRVERDGFGRPVRVTDVLGAITCFEWSPAGKLLRRIDADGHSESWSWDGEGNLLTHTDRADHRTSFTYGVFDLLASRVDPDGSITCYQWDNERRLTAVINPLGHTWSYVYDTAGRLISETDYNEATTHYTHDPVGRVTSITTACGNTRRLTHDRLGRVSEIASDSGEWLRYRHDAAGRVLAAVAGDGEKVIHTLEFGYTIAGLLASQQLDDQPVMTYGYDLHGRRTARTTPSGATTDWHWDYSGHVRGMSTAGRHVTFAYDALGRPTGWQVGEIAVTQTLSDIGRMTEQQVVAFPNSTLTLDASAATRPAPRDLRHDTFAYRPDGYLANHTITRSGSPERRDYTLDAVGRVTALSHDGSLTSAYSYDTLSNIVSDNLPSASPTVTATDTMQERRAEPAVGQTNSADDRREYHRNLLIRDGRTRYHYDAAGRLIRKVTTRISRKPAIWHYRYNGFDQLTDVRTPDGQSWRYTYDAAGRRVTKQRLNLDGATRERTDYTWDGTYLIEQAFAESTTRWQYQPTSRRPIAQITDQATVDQEFYAIVTDLVGTPTELLDPVTADVAATATTDLWGSTTWHGIADTPLRFPGQIHDPETGLHYNLYRTYDPCTGRFLTVDPLGLAPAPNPNAYPHNPTVWSDPLGLVPDECHRDFAHGTSLKHAEDIVDPDKGLNSDAARANSHGGSMNRPGSFFTHEVEDGNSPGVQSAYEWGLRVDPNSPSTVIIGRLPESVYQQLLERKLVIVRDAGEGVPEETIFHPNSFAILKKEMQWIAKFTPGH